MRIPHGVPALFGAILLLTLASCTLFDTTVSRDLRAVWSPDGTSLLVVRSEYTTSKPDEPYHATEKAKNFRLILDKADGTAIDPLTTRTTIDEFDEGMGLGGSSLAQGGTPENEPVYWFPALNRAVFGGRTAAVRDVHRHVGWKAPVPVADLEAALGAVDEVEPSLTAALVASNMEIWDAVPSPNGTVLAVLFYNFFSLGDLVQTTYEYRVIGFFDLSTSPPALLRAVRVSPEVWHLYREITALPELTGRGRDPNWATMAWKSDGSGVWSYLYDSDNPEFPVGREVQWVPLTGTPVLATQVPERPLPTSSGSVSPAGVGYWLETVGNASALKTTAIAGWQPHDKIPLVDVATFLNESDPLNSSLVRYNF